MGGSPLLIALWNLAMLALLGGLVWLVTWALFGDRNRGTPRCPRCWHDMSGATSLRCSECGFQAPSEQALHRRRRHWGLATVALLATLSLAFHIRNTWLATGWTSIVPTRVAIWLLPWSDTYSALEDIHEELGHRLLYGPMSTANLRSLLERIAEGDDGARPGTSAWQAKYGRLLLHWMSLRQSRGVPSAASTASIDLAAVEARLARLPPVLTADPPAAWVVGEPLPLDLVVQRPISTQAEQRLVVGRTTLPAEPPTPLPPVNVPVLLGTVPHMIARVPLLLAPLPPGTHSGKVEVRVEDRDADGTWREVAVLDVPVEVVVLESIPVPPPRRIAARTGTVPPPRTAVPAEGEARDEDEARDTGRAAGAGGDTVASATPGDADEPREFLPLRGAALDEAVRVFAAPGLMRWAMGDRRFAMRFDPSAVTTPPLRGVALGVEAEILEDGEVRRRVRAWWTGSVGGLRFEPPQEDPERLERANMEDGRWTLRVRGVRELALRSALAARSTGRRGWWDGEVTMPLRIEEISAPAPQRAWSVGILPIEPRDGDTVAPEETAASAAPGAPAAGP